MEHSIRRNSHTGDLQRYSKQHRQGIRFKHRFRKLYKFKFTPILESYGRLKEIKLCNDKNFRDVSLGETRLRAETAGIVACHTFSIANM